MNIANLAGADLLVEEGSRRFFEKDITAAIAKFHTALVQNPRQVVALTNLATCYLFLNENETALKFARKAVKLAPHFPEALKNLGFLYQKLKMYKKSLPVFEKAIKLNSADLESYKGKIIALKELKVEGKEIVDCIKKIAKLKPTDPDLLYNLGNLSARHNLMREAAFFFKQTILQRPKFIPALVSLTLIYTHLGKKKLKIQTYKKIISRDESKVWIVWAYNQMALAYLQDFKYAKVVSCLKKCLEIDPYFSKTYSNLYLTYRQMCDWKNADKISKHQDFLAVEDPFLNVLRSEDPLENLNKAKLAIRELTNNFPPQPLVYGPAKPKIRLGYLSSDFRNHPIGMMVASMFGHHDRKRFEVYLYSGGINDHTYYRTRPEKEADNFFDVSLLKPDELARKINADRIDILIDLTGFTLGTKLEACAYHPAPVQISYLGFPGSTGADFMDYIIVDEIIAPATDEPLFAEKTIILPHCYQINDSCRPISSKKFTRADFGLPENEIVYASFNQSFKFDPITFEAWMDVLKNVPGSTLWLMEQGKGLSHNLRKCAQTYKIDPQRLIFSSVLPNEQHLKRLQLADIALDTRIYGGHTSTTDCMYAGIPVITIIGKHFASRVPASILTTFGVPELITKSIKDYKHLAIKLGRDKEKLLRLKRKIRDLRPNNPLFDTKRFVANLEKAYIKIWKQHTSNREPASIKILP